MARFVTVHVRCDWTECPETGEEGDGTIVEKTVTVDKAPAKAFLLCKKHLEAFETVVLPLLQAGIKVDQPSPKRAKTSSASVPGAASAAAAVEGNGNGHKNETFECRVPGCGRTISKRTGMAQHVTRTHDFESLADYEAQYPDSTID